jgi:acyl-coenzyme A synthetase/AMP-(fatty) acid ligase
MEWSRRQSSRYWDDTAIKEWLEVGGGAENKRMPYESLYFVTAWLVVKLREIIKGLLSSEHTVSLLSEKNVSVPIAIAIPEGLCLPLSVAAVHSLNDDERYAAVMVPIDPAEGTERLRLILNDSKPLLTLVASDCDETKLQEVAASYMQLPNAELYYAFDGGRPLYMSPNTTVVDVRKLLAELPRKATLIHGPTSTLSGKKTRCSSGGLRSTVHAYEQRIFENAAIGTCLNEDVANRISHIVYTSGTTGAPKGCISSINSLSAYLDSKNIAHGITMSSVVLLASAVSFDPCMSDILATFDAGATLFLAPREDLSARLHEALVDGNISHVLCTPTLWGTLAIHGKGPKDFPKLRVVALGGEQIPRRTVRTWWRRDEASQCKLFATYGTTEACVYQTMAEVSTESHDGVGFPFEGMYVVVCEESIQETVAPVHSPHDVGEVVLLGRQLDAYSSYLRRPELTQRKFFYDQTLRSFCYRTGDRGFLATETHDLHVLGRIDGEGGMIKFNGIRIELGEIEAAIVDAVGAQDPVVVDSMAILQGTRGGETSQTLCAYIVLSNKCLEEIGILAQVPRNGAICTGVLLALLLHRSKARARVAPSVFIIIAQIPLTRTGKRDRMGAPPLRDTISLVDSGSLVQNGIPLSRYGPVGAVVAEQIIDCLNLLSSQLCLMTTSATFAMLGGDSLAATRIVRALYAYHHNIWNSRNLGGAFGVLDDDTFSVSHLLRARNLGSYVDFLQSKNVCLREELSSRYPAQRMVLDTSPVSTEASHLYDIILQAITEDKLLIALALIEAGATPNLKQENRYRISNTRGLQERKKAFHSTPLHLACLKGQYRLARVLLEHGAKYNIPDASGNFPIHLLAAGRSTGEAYSEKEDVQRLESMQLLLKVGAPLTMKDGSRQTAIHCSARSGHIKVLSFLLDRWKHDFIACDPLKHAGSLEWRDRWYRTPVHWAILNGQFDALRVLLENGCSPSPVMPKKNRSSSAALETPQEMCDRLYARGSPTGVAITTLLEDAKATSNGLS